jgi:putative spermidine/putrescine transport system ATP-binding protein
MAATAELRLAETAVRNPPEVLRLEGVTKHYDGRAALDGISLAIPGDAYISLLGPSGSGKTVLLRVIAGFEAPDSGTVQFGGKRIDTMPAHLRGIGFVFQNFALFPHLSVFDNIAFGLTNRTDNPVTDQSQLQRKVGEMIELVGLTGLEERGVHQISGGQKQRVALARTLVTQPRIVLLDEPLGALDANLRTRMRGELRRIRSQLGVTFLHVTGSETEALAMGDRVVVLDRGRIGQFDAPDTVYNTPASPNVARFLNCYNIFEGRIEQGAFLAEGTRFPVASTLGRAAAPAYAVRQDLIAIRPEVEGPGPGETGLVAEFLTSEYSGSAVMYFFQLPSGKVVEVENHLSHRAPADLEPHHRYSLVWKVAEPVVFE